MSSEPAVSPVISEVLLIALVLILVPIVTINLMNQVPEDRTPTVTILMGPLHGSTVNLYHKGGDWIRKEDIKIFVNNQDGYYQINKSPFDLGDSISIFQVSEGSDIRLVAKNAVIFSGVAHS